MDNKLLSIFKEAVAELTSRNYVLLLRELDSYISSYYILTDNDDLIENLKHFIGNGYPSLINKLVKLNYDYKPYLTDLFLNKSREDMVSKFKLSVDTILILEKKDIIPGLDKETPNRPKVIYTDQDMNEFIDSTTPLNAKKRFEIGFIYLDENDERSVSGNRKLHFLFLKKLKELLDSGSRYLSPIVQKEFEYTKTLFPEHVSKLPTLK